MAGCERAEITIGISHGDVKCGGKLSISLLRALDEITISAPCSSARRAARGSWLTVGIPLCGNGIRPCNTDITHLFHPSGWRI